MECSQCTPSIIARLMGLDELPPRQSVQKQQRVLSENYLRRVASIGVRREKRPSRVHHAFRMGIEEEQEIQDVRDMFYNLSGEKDKSNSSSSETNMETRQKVDVKWTEFHDVLNIDNCLLNYLQESDSLYTTLRNDRQGVSPHSQSRSTGVLKPSHASDRRSIDICRKIGRITEQGKFMSLQKLKDTCVTDSHRQPTVGKFQKFPRSHLDLKESPSRIAVLKPKLRKSSYVSSPISYEGSPSGAKNHKEFFSFDNGNLRKNLVEEHNKTVKKNLKLSRDISKEILSKTTKRTTIGLKELSSSKSRGGELSVEDSAYMMHSSPASSFSKKQYQLVFNLDESFNARKAKKRMSERWKMLNKFQEVGMCSRRFTLAEMLAIPNHEMRPSESDAKFVKHDLSNHIGFDDAYVTFGSPSDFGSEDVSKYGLAENNHSVHDKPNNKLKYMNLSEPNSVVPKSSVTSFVSGNLIAHMVTDAEADLRRKELPFELPGLAKDDDSSSTSLKQEISVGVPEASCCSGTCLESFVNLDKVYLPSPDSVLEIPYKEEISSCSGSFESFNADFHECSETSSEGPAMNVSSYEDSGEDSGEYSKEYKDFRESFRVEDSRDFSYLVDILTEAGFHDKNLDIGVVTWHTPEYPISPTVFEELEKCREQTSWKRSERRLLFDRINSIMLDILQPRSDVPSWAKPMTFKFNLKQTWVVNDEELWMSLVSQEKQAKKDSSDKMLGQGIGWLELGEEIEVIVTDIESLLIDELVVEVISSDRN